MTMRRFRRMRRRPQATTDRRTPDERLEAFFREQSLERRERIFDRIRDDLFESRDVTPWIRAARTLADRLIISEDAAYYLGVMFADIVVLHAAEEDAELVRIDSEMGAIERAHRLSTNDPKIAEKAPEPWHVLHREWEARADAILAGALRDAGQSDIARVMDTDRKEFDRRVERGEIDVWGEDESN
jgi:hypothetical protein